MVKRILVLDDNQDILEIVHETLTYENFEVKSTSDGDDVMPLMDDFGPDLVILDYRAAGTNGGELCQKIKAHPKFADIPVILFSAYISRDAELMAYGADAIISKPFDLNEFVEKVNNLINS